MKSLLNLCLAAMSMVSAHTALADDGSCYCSQQWIWGGCATTECTSHLDGGGGGAPAPTNSTITYKNGCARQINTAITYQNLSGQWSTDGWWTLYPGQTAVVALTRDINYYLYAETTDANAVTKITWSGNDYHAPIRGQGDYGFQAKKFPDNSFDNLTQTISCPGVTAYKPIAVAWNAQGAWQSRIANRVDDASAAALSACNQNGGNCTIAGWLSADAYDCFTLASALGGHLWFSHGTNQANAHQAALTQCIQANIGDCSVAIEACNL